MNNTILLKNGKRGSEVLSFISHFAMLKAMKPYRHHSIVQLFLKIEVQENFLALICHPSRRKGIHLQTGGGARPAQNTEIAAKKSLMVKDQYQLLIGIIVII
jgi:hypothetical protein